jgi:mRNA interferase MazF
MKRGELYRVFKGNRADPRQSRVYVVVSRQALIESKFSTVICAPIYSQRHGLSTQVDVGVEEGLKADSCIQCDELMSLSKTQLTRFIGALSPSVLTRLDHALRVALALGG